MRNESITINKYEKYKDSGIEWIGKIPKHWKLNRNKNIFNYSKGKNPQKLELEKHSEEYYAYLSMEYLRNKKSCMTFYSKNENYVLVNEGDLLLLWDGSKAGEFILGKEGILSSTMVKIISKTNINKDYLKFLSYEIQRFIQERTIGMGIPHISSEILKNMRCPFPPLQEQEQIANYLDTKTKQIDKVIQNTQIQIEKLKEYEKSLINKAVTKGLNENVELKDSDIEWIGEIPKHWEVKKLKYISKIILGQSVDSNSINNINEGIPFFQGKAEFGLIYPKIRFYTINPIKIANKNDILISVRAPVGDLNISNCKCCIGRGLSAIRYHNYKYLYYVLYSAYYEFNKFVTGSTFEAISGEDIKNIQIPFIVDNIEQEQIANHLDNQTKIIQNLIKNKQTQLNLYQELRKSVINDAVTGKVKVI